MPGRRRADAVPRHQEAAEGIGRHRLHFASQAGQRAAAQGAQHLGVGELVLGAARSEGALQQDALLDQGAQALLDARRGDAPASRRRVRGEGAVGARPAQQAERRAAGCRRHPRPGATSRPRRPAGWRRRRRDSGPRPRSRSIDPRPPAAARRCVGPWPALTGRSRPRAGPCGLPPHRSAGHRPVGPGRGARPPSAPDVRRPAPAAPAPGPSWRQGRAAHAAPPRRAARPAARGRGRGPARGAPPAGRRPRRGRCRCSRTAARSRMARPTASPPRPPGWRVTGSRPAPPCSAGTSKTSPRISR